MIFHIRSKCVFAALSIFTVCKAVPIPMNDGSNGRATSRQRLEASSSFLPSIHSSFQYNPQRFEEDQWLSNFDQHHYLNHFPQDSLPPLPAQLSIYGGYTEPLDVQHPQDNYLHSHDHPFPAFNDGWGMNNHQYVHDAGTSSQPDPLPTATITPTDLFYGQPYYDDGEAAEQNQDEEFHEQESEDNIDTDEDAPNKDGDTIIPWTSINDEDRSRIHQVIQEKLKHLPSTTRIRDATTRMTPNIRDLLCSQYEGEVQEGLELLYLNKKGLRRKRLPSPPRADIENQVLPFVPPERIVLYGKQESGKEDENTPSIWKRLDTPTKDKIRTVLQLCYSQWNTKTNQKYAARVMTLNMARLLLSGDWSKVRLAMANIHDRPQRQKVVWGKNMTVKDRLKVLERVSLVANCKMDHARYILREKKATPEQAQAILNSNDPKVWKRIVKEISPRSGLKEQLDNDAQ
jgi:hypothetical protein